MMTRIVSVVVLLGVTGSCGAAVIFDQITGHIDNTGPGHTSQLDPTAPAFVLASCDDFFVSGGIGKVTTVEVMMNGLGGFTAASFANVTDWSVQIYSGPTAAGTNLAGDAASVSGLTPTITLATTNNWLISFDLSGSGVTLADGNYWIGVVPTLVEAGNGALGIIESSTNAGLSPQPDAGLFNAAGGWGFPSNVIGLHVNLAYRISAVPIPCPGDLNGDGVVDGADLGILLGAWGLCA